MALPTHGMAGSKFYRKYLSIIFRCTNPNATNYYRYGGRGIINEWKSFEEFKTDMYESYLEHVKMFGEKNTTIERMDNNLNYSKDNCRWATKKSQARNRTGRCKMITYNGVTKNLSAWSEDLGIRSSTIRMRLTYGWSIGKALGFE